MYNRLSRRPQRPNSVKDALCEETCPYIEQTALWISFFGKWLMQLAQELQVSSVIAQKSGRIFGSDCDIFAQIVLAQDLHR